MNALEGIDERVGNEKHAFDRELLVLFEIVGEVASEKLDYHGSLTGVLAHVVEARDSGNTCEMLQKHSLIV